MSVLGPIVGKKASTPATVGRGEDDAVQLELARRTWTESTGPADRQADRQRPVLPKPPPPLRNRGPATASILPRNAWDLAVYVWDEELVPVDIEIFDSDHPADDE